MTAVLLLAAVAPQTQRPYDDKFFADLLNWRTQFEEVLVEGPADNAYHHVQSESLGGAHARGFYPLAAERFIVSFSGDGVLIYQRRSGSKVIEPWTLPLVDSKSKAKVVGTIPTYLKSLGYRISPKAKITAEMRRRLAKSDHFVEYIYHHFQGAYATVIDPKGKPLKTHHTEEKFFITPEEKALLLKGVK